MIYFPLGYSFHCLVSMVLLMLQRVQLRLPAGFRRSSLSTTCRLGSVSQTKPTGGRSPRFVCRRSIGLKGGGVWWWLRCVWPGGGASGGGGGGGTGAVLTSHSVSALVAPIHPLAFVPLLTIQILGLMLLTFWIRVQALLTRKKIFKKLKSQSLGVQREQFLANADKCALYEQPRKAMIFFETIEYF